MQGKPSIRVELKEVLTQSRLFGKLKQNSDLADPNLDFDVFVKLWIVNEGNFPITVRGYSLGLDTGNNIVWAERVRGDLHKWHIDDAEETVGMWGEPRTERTHRQMTPDLDARSAEALERGIHRDGWLHFLFRDVRLSSIQTGAIVAVVEDSLLKRHEGIGKGPRKVPGEVWPNDIG